MEFRLASTSDIDSLSELRWQDKVVEESVVPAGSKEEFFEAFGVYLHEHLNQSLNVWVAEENNEIVANVYITRVRKVPNPKCYSGEIAYASGVFTLRHMRNKGLGQALFEKVKAWSEKEGIELIILWPSERAKPFYERLGFKNENDVIELEF